MYLDQTPQFKEGVFYYNGFSMVTYSEAQKEEITQLLNRLTVNKKSRSLKGTFTDTKA